MCGRYCSLFDKQQISEHLHVQLPQTKSASSHRTTTLYPVIPSSSFAAVVRTGKRELAMMRWGIVPWFAKTEDEFKKLSTINARSDGIADSKKWREPFA
jgi:putative SOS response-associated peptidase YedK